MGLRANDGIQTIARQSSAAQTELLELNNRHARETSYLDTDAWEWLIGQAFAATVSADLRSFLIAFDQGAEYDSTNFIWFRSRFHRFVYIDRIVVAPDVRRRGLARRLYEDLFERAWLEEHERVVCEVNRIPPNPGSDAFHDRLGFTAIGHAQLPDTKKVVRYLERKL
jgi:predicted GNAT superfamily acetyltransferase